MQELTDIVVIERLPLAAGPAHTVFPVCWTLPSSSHVQQVAPHHPEDLQGFCISVAQGPLNKRSISEGTGQKLLVK